MWAKGPHTVPSSPLWLYSEKNPIQTVAATALHSLSKHALPLHMTFNLRQQLPHMRLIYSQNISSIASLHVRFYLAALHAKAHLNSNSNSK
jgi:hypothetical protein